MSDETVAEAPVVETAVEKKPEISEVDIREKALSEMPETHVAAIGVAQSKGVKLHAIPVFESVYTDDKSWYTYRTIKRQEWHKLQFEHRQRLQAAKEELTQAEVESMFEDAVVALCSIAPKIDLLSIGAFDAGAISTLADAIMFSSGFNQNSVPVKL